MGSPGGAVAALRPPIALLDSPHPVIPNLSVLLDQLVPEALEPFLQPLVGRVLPRGKDGRFRVRGYGRFRGSYTADLLRLAQGQKLDGALILADQDVSRVLLFVDGIVVGAHSNVLFERLGRVLYKGGVISKTDAHSLVDCEEKAGLDATIALIPEEAALWGVERRVWEIGASLYFMGHGHYLCVDGSPRMGRVPAVAIDPTQIAMEGMRRYDEWRNGSRGTSEEVETPIAEPPTPTDLDREAIERRAARGAGVDSLPPSTKAQKEADAIMRSLLGDGD